MDETTSSSSTDIVKVELVNQPDLTEKMKEQALIAMAGAAGTILITKGAELIAKLVIARRRKKKLEEMAELKAQIEDN